MIIAFGSNLPHGSMTPVDTVVQAVRLVASLEGVTLVKQSHLYRTAAVPAGSGPDFVNGVAVYQTDHSPDRVLAELHEIEAVLGRRRDGRWAPRVCDIDLIAVGQTVLPDMLTLRRWMALDLGSAQTVSPPHLVLPHPRLHERAFVLLPMQEVAPDWRHPATGRSVAEMVLALPPEDHAMAVPFDTDRA